MIESREDFRFCGKPDARFRVTHATLWDGGRDAPSERLANRNLSRVDQPVKMSATETTISRNHPNLHNRITGFEHNSQGRYWARKV